MTKTLSSQGRGPGYDPSSGNQIPHHATKGSNATIKDPTCCNNDRRPSVPQRRPRGSDGKESACNAGDTGSLGQEDPLENGMATHSGILAWEITQTEGLQSMGSQRVGYDRETNPEPGAAKVIN